MHSSAEHFPIFTIMQKSQLRIIHNLLGGKRGVTTGGRIGQGRVGEKGV